MARQGLVSVLVGVSFIWYLKAWSWLEYMGMGVLRNDYQRAPAPYNSSMTFRPLPFLGNPHVQTILGSLWKGPPVSLPSRLHVVPLPDGDALAAHETTPPEWVPGAPIVLLVHGLGGCHR